MELKDCKTIVVLPLRGLRDVGRAWANVRHLAALPFLILLFQVCTAAIVAPSPHPSTIMTTVSPFARSSAFDEPRLSGREQTVRIEIWVIIYSVPTEIFTCYPSD
jgi:hypothetical protein